MPIVTGVGAATPSGEQLPEVPVEADEMLAHVVHAWIDHPSSVLVHPGAQYLALLRRLLVGIGQGGPIVSDAHLAALAIEQQTTLLTFDCDFARFAGVRLKTLA